MLRSKTYSAKTADIKRTWYVIDASQASLGRVAAVAATHLIGKHKPQFTAHIDCGDGVIVINATKLKLTGKKLEQKVYYRHSGYPGSLKEATAGELMEKNPVKVVEAAVKGMLPKNKLQPGWLKRLKVYTDENHGQEAQKPQNLEVR